MFSPNFIYAIIVTRSSLGFLHIILYIFFLIGTKVMALYLHQSSILLNILRTYW